MNIPFKTSAEWARLFAAGVAEQNEVLANAIEEVIKRECPELDSGTFLDLCAIVRGGIVAGENWQASGRSQFFRTPEGIKIHKESMDRINAMEVQP